MLVNWYKNIQLPNKALKQNNLGFINIQEKCNIRNTVAVIDSIVLKKIRAHEHKEI